MPLRNYTLCDIMRTSEVIALLGDRLRTLRKKHGMTQQELADALGVSASTIGMYEQGRREPENSTLTAICRLFHVSSDYFLMGGPAPGDTAPNAELNEVIDEFRDRLLSQEGLMFDGVPMSDEDIAQVIRAIQVGAMVAVDKLRRKHPRGEDKN